MNTSTRRDELTAYLSTLQRERRYLESRLILTEEKLERVKQAEANTLKKLEAER